MKPLRTLPRPGVGQFLFPLAAAVAAALTAVLFARTSPSEAYPFNQCLRDFEHWYARAISGEGMTNQGTNVATVTPLHWSVDRPSSSVWDEASWLVHQNGNDISNSLEVGFYSGWFPYFPYGWTDGLLPYYTINDGYPGFQVGDSSSYVPGNTSNVSIGAENNTGGLMAGASWVWNYWFYPSYHVNAPALNLHQGEVYGISRTWMGGGVGEQFSGYWMDNNRMYVWGFHDDCADSPYWIQSLNYYMWKNGGYGS